MAGERFRVQDIVHPDMHVIVKQFECAICLNIFDNPVQTPCAHIFCKQCVAPCHLCPVCREPAPADQVRALADCNKPMIRMMHSMTVRCPNGNGATIHDGSAPNGRAAVSDVPRPFKRARREGDACKWVGSYSDLLANHLAVCSYQIVCCPRGCGERLRRCDLESHHRLCKLGFEVCSICGAEVKRGDMDKHRSETSAVHAVILEKKLFESEEDRKELAGRLARMELKMNFLAKASQVVRVKDTVAEMANQVTSVKKTARNIGRKGMQQAVWKISDVGNLLRNYPRGKAKSSGTFTLGHAKFTLLYYPNGDDDSPAGKAGLWIYGGIGFEWEVKLSIDDVEETYSNEEDECAAICSSDEEEDSDDDGDDDGCHSYGSSTAWPIPASTDSDVVIRAELVQSAILI